MKISLYLPTFMFPKWLNDDLERRAAFNGKASRSWSDRFGILSATVSIDRKDGES